MANATRVVAVVPVIPPDKVILELTVKEAEVLRALTGAVLGSKASARTLADGVYHTLSAAGVSSYHSSGKVERGSYIRFKDDDEIVKE